MNCDQFKKQLMTDPYDQSDAFLEHRKSCDSCARQYRAAIQFEKSLSDAFQIPVESDQQDKLAESVIKNNQQTKKRKRQIIAIAASLLILASSLFIGNELWKRRTLQDFVLAHIDHEIEFLRNSRKLETLEYMPLLKQFNSEFLSQAGPITYAHKCWMRSSYGAHLILAGKKGPVTLLWMPGEFVSETMPLDYGQLVGKIYEATGGSFALVGEPGEMIESIAEAVRMASAMNQ